MTPFLSKPQRHPSNLTRTSLGRIARSIALIAALFLTACAAEQLAYSPRYVAPANAVQQLREALNAEQHVPALVEVTPTYMKTVSLSTTSQLYYSATEFARYADVADIRLYRKRSYFRVLLFDRDGAELFKYESRRLDDALRFADAVHALR